MLKSFCVSFCAQVVLCPRSLDQEVPPTHLVSVSLAAVPLATQTVAQTAAQTADVLLVAYVVAYRWWLMAALLLFMQRSSTIVEAAQSSRPHFKSCRRHQVLLQGASI